MPVHNEKGTRLLKTKARAINLKIRGVPIAVVAQRLGFEQQRFAEMSAGSNPAVRQVFQPSV